MDRIVVIDHWPAAWRFAPTCPGGGGPPGRLRAAARRLARLPRRAWDCDRSVEPARPRRRAVRAPAGRSPRQVAGADHAAQARRTGRHPGRPLLQPGADRAEHRRPRFRAGGRGARLPGRARRKSDEPGHRSLGARGPHSAAIARHGGPKLVRKYGLRCAKWPVSMP